MLLSHDILHSSVTCKSANKNPLFVGLINTKVPEVIVYTLFDLAFSKLVMSKLQSKGLSFKSDARIWYVSISSLYCRPNSSIEKSPNGINWLPIYCFSKTYCVGIICLPMVDSHDVSHTTVSFLLTTSLYRVSLSRILLIAFLSFT